MPYPCDYKNTGTEKTYRLTLTKGKQLSEIKASCDKDNWGSVDWEVQEKTFSVHTLQSHPEKGSGLGSLLMYLAAGEARHAGCTGMKILNAAQNERDFYLLMGCKVDASVLSGLDRSQFTDEDWAKLVASCPLIGVPDEVVAASSKSVGKRWAGAKAP